MAEPKRLSKEVLEAHRLYARHNNLLDRIATNAIFSHIAALDTEIAAMRQLMRELTADKRAGIANDDIGECCIYCYCTSDYTYGENPYAHTPDCPIVRGRALVQVQEECHA